MVATRMWMIVMPGLRTGWAFADGKPAIV